MAELASLEILVGLLSSTLRMATPILAASLGEIFAERSGVLNLGLEGVMLESAFMSFWVTYLTDNLWIGVLTGMAVGGLMSLIHAYLAVSLHADQVVSGIAIWLVGTGLSSFQYRAAFGIVFVPPAIAGFKPLSIPVLSEIPFLGPILFQHDILVYLVILLVPLAAFVLYRTTLGMKIRAVGENPAAADTSGINIYRIRYLCVILGGMLAGLGGAYLTLSYTHLFADYVTAGRGWIAIALVIFARWDPYRALLGSILFGGADAIQLRLQVLGVGIPYEFFVMLPYIVTMIALLLVYKRAGAPAALCVPYKREEEK